jgi:CDP-diacylglycerol---glycerol-3-phosphate 3-phosphatidyltransferase
MTITDDKTDRTQGEPGSVPAVAPIDRRSLNLPNAITLSRLVLALVVFVLIYIEGLWLTAAAVFLVAAATDALDGYLARRYGQITTLGRILDPFVDKIIICGAFIFLLEKKLDSGVNSWMVVIVIGREMFVTGLRSFLEQVGRDFSASFSGKLKMGMQCAALTASLISLRPEVAAITVGGIPFNTFRDVLLWATVAVTVYSGFVYIQRAYVMLRPAKDK